MKKIFLFALVSIALAAVSCGGGEDEVVRTATIITEPEGNAVEFTAAAEETKTITVTTEPTGVAWSYTISDENAWCTVQQTGDDLVLSALPNESETAPTPLTLIITASGADPVVITITQKANQGEVTYPGSKAELVEKISGTWAFTESSPYLSLTFDREGNYFLINKVILTRQDTDGGYENITGSYDISDADLKDITLAGFGTLRIETLSTVMRFKLTPQGGTAYADKATRQTIPGAAAKERRIINCQWTESGAEIDNGTDYTFEYDGDRLAGVNITGEDKDAIPYDITIDITYVTDTSVTMEIPARALGGDQGTFKTTYILSDPAGVAVSAIVELDGTRAASYNYFYNSARQLVSTVMYATPEGGAPDLAACCEAAWQNGNITSLRYKKYGGAMPAVELFAATYSDTENNGSIYPLHGLCDLYLNEGFDFIAYYAGFLGNATVNLMTAYGNEESTENIEYAPDNDGYSSQAVITGSGGHDGLSIQAEFAFE